MTFYFPRRREAKWKGEKVEKNGWRPRDQKICEMYRLLVYDKSLPRRNTPAVGIICSRHHFSPRFPCVDVDLQSTMLLSRSALLFFSHSALLSVIDVVKHLYFFYRTPTGPIYFSIADEFRVHGDFNHRGWTSKSGGAGMGWKEKFH